MSHFTDTSEIYEIFQQELTEVVENCIRELGGYDKGEGKALFIHDGHYRKVKKIFEKVQEDSIGRFHTDQPRQKSWPFNDSKLVVKEKFALFYDEIRRHTISYNDSEGNELIELAEGRPYSREKGTDNKFGNVVLKADIPAIMQNTGLGKSSVHLYFRKLVAAGVLIKLNTARNRTGLYVIGDWQKTLQSYKINWRLNRQEFRDELTKGLLEQSLALSA